MVAAALDPSVCFRVDDFMTWIVNGWVEPGLSESAHQNRVLGAAAAAAAIQFACGGYTVVLDGTFFPDGAEGMSQMCRPRAVPLHYAVLRPDLATCQARVARRGSGDPDDPQFARLHARFADLGDREVNVVEASNSPQQVVGAVLAAFASGRLSLSH
jgi:hypothetical protein